MMHLEAGVPAKLARPLEGGGKAQAAGQIRGLSFSTHPLSDNCREEMDQGTIPLGPLPDGG